MPRTAPRHRPSARRAGAVAVTVALTFVAACGGDDDTSSAPASSTVAPPQTTTTAVKATTTAAARAAFDACELLSQERADQVMGRSLQAGVPSGPPDDNHCNYTGPPEGS